MKKLNKFLPIIASLTLLVGCSTTPSLKDGKTNVVNVTDGEKLTISTYQDIFDDLYESKGTDVAVKNLLVNVSKYVLLNSGHWTEAQIENELNARVVDKFDEFYTSTYRVDGLFDEEKLITSLLGQGYKITKKTADPFKETIDTLVGYDHLKSHLTYDYSDYEEALKKDMYTDLLKEEYVRSQKATSKSFFTERHVRKVSYFSYTPENSTDANEFATNFQSIIDKAIEENVNFKEVITGANGLDFAWKLNKLKQLARDFAMINKVAAEGSSVNANPDYPLPEKYANAVAQYEAEYVNNTTYGYRDIYSADGKVNFDASEISETKTKLTTYSNSGANSIYKGYYLKQLDIINTSYYTETVFTADTNQLISTAVTNALDDWDSLYGESNYLDVNKTGTPVYKNGSTYYVVYAEVINDSSVDADIKAACKELAKTSSNVKNAIYYYLTSLTEEGKLSIHNQDVYDYLNSTYSYGEED